VVIWAVYMTEIPVTDIAFLLREERIISGSGVLRVPPENWGDRAFALYFNVIREVPQPNPSFKYIPERSRYATINLMQDGYVVEELTLDFPKRVFYRIADPSGQALFYAKCAFSSTIQTIVSLGLALDLEFEEFEPSADENKDFQPLRLPWNEVFVRCEGSTALQVLLYSVPYATCDFGELTIAPPIPDEITERVPPGETIGDISPPYEEDDDITDPAEIDQPEPGTGQTGTPCAIWIVDWTVTQSNGQSLSGSTNVRAPFTEQLVVENFNGVPRDLFLVSASSASSGSTTEQCVNQQSPVFLYRTPLSTVTITSFSLDDVRPQVPPG
jgi:hypothetical protein